MSKSNSKIVERQNEAKIRPDNVIAGALYFVETDQRMAYYPTEIHGIVEEMKEACPLLEAFVFSYKGIKAHSPILVEVLRGLRLSRIVTLHPADGRFTVSKEAKEYIEENILGLFNQEEIDQLKKIGKKIYAELKAK